MRTSRILMAAGVAVLIGASSLGLAPSASASPATISVGTLGKDQNGNPLQLHGLGIIKVGNTYYGFGEDKTGENKDTAAFRAIPCYTSTNLVNWTYKNEALNRQSSGDLGPNRVVERPKVLYNSTTGQYVMYVHIDSATYKESKVGVATSSTPCGPYTYRGSFKPLGNSSFDIGLFKDTDGAGYLLSEDNGKGLHIYYLSKDYLSVSEQIAVLGDWESPAMFKVGTTYFLLGSHLTGWSTNDNSYTSSSKLSGGWAAWKNFAPAGTHTDNSQTANVITVQGSQSTTYVYAGDRWTTDNLGTSPLVWLPLTVSGSSLAMTIYKSWSIDTATGRWSNGVK